MKLIKTMTIAAFSAVFFIAANLVSAGCGDGDTKFLLAHLRSREFRTDATTSDLSARGYPLVSITLPGLVVLMPLFSYSVGNLLYRAKRIGLNLVFGTVDHSRQM